MAETSFLEHSGISDWHCLSNTYQKRVCSFVQMQDSMILSRFPFPVYLSFTISALPCPTTDTTLSLHPACLPPHSCSHCSHCLECTFPLFLPFPQIPPIFQSQLFKHFLPQELLIQTLIACDLNYMTTFQGPYYLQSLTLSTHLLHRCWTILI